MSFWNSVRIQSMTCWSRWSASGEPDLLLLRPLPKRIWVFKTPKGMKGSIQLVGSLLVSDEPRVAVKTEYPL
jgi:hypothetical protein